MPREQIKLTYQIGTNDWQGNLFTFSNTIVCLASQLCGGCSYTYVKGAWRDDGSEHKETFNGSLNIEDTLQLELTCEVHKVERVEADMKAILAQRVREYGFDIDWVHVSATVMEGRHFSVKAINEGKA